MTVTVQKQPLALFRILILQTSVGDLQARSIWSLICLNCRQSQREGEDSGELQAAFRSEGDVDISVLLGWPVGCFLLPK